MAEFLIRDTRSAGKERLTPAERVDLLQLTQMPGWGTLMDLFEAECIRQETKLLNLPAGQRAEILAEFALSKAFWQVFVGIQRKVYHEIEEGLTAQGRPSSGEDEGIAGILDPTKEQQL